MITLNNIIDAHNIIKKYIYNTPILTSNSINTIHHAKLFFKCENFQKVGAFKIRGATNAVFSLSKDIAKNGVATHSSGNHAAALTLAARWFGIKSYIVMPKNSPQVKINAVQEYGANITFCEPNQKAREETLDKIVKHTEATFIHPYNNEKVIAGQATIALEILEKIKDLDIIIAPVGGGGLLSGTALIISYLNPAIKVFGAEPEGADDAKRSLEQNKIIPSINPKTIADGLLTSLGTLTFPIIKSNVHKIFTVSDKEIIKSMKMIWERMKIIIEPSSAVPLAVIKNNPTIFKDKKIGVILSGGNVDLSKLPFR